MNMLKKFVAAAACSLAFGSANATMISTFQTFEPAVDKAVTKAAPFTFTFNLNDLLAAEGVTSTDILSAYLDIFLTDPLKGQETFSIMLGNNLQSVTGNDAKNQVNNGGITTVDRINLAAALADLKFDGELAVKFSVSSKEGDYAVRSAKLTAFFEEPVVVTPPVDVPEPASAALLGLGMLGFLAARRRRA